jgi:hypothetical protein
MLTKISGALCILAVVAMGGSLIFAPGMLRSGSGPGTLIILLCPVSMLIMMWSMRAKRSMNNPQVTLLLAVGATAWSGTIAQGASPLSALRASSAPAAVAAGTTKASTSIAPVTIRSVRVANRKSDEGQRGRIWLVFRNDGISVADEIRFTVHDGYASVTLTVLGTFSPGVLIERRFQNPKPDSFSQSWLQTDAEVNYVHFVDGTSWTQRRSNTKEFE